MNDLDHMLSKFSYATRVLRTGPLLKIFEDANENPYPDEDYSCIERWSMEEEIDLFGLKDRGAVEEDNDYTDDTAFPSDSDSIVDFPTL